MIVRPDSRLGALRYKIVPKCLLPGPFRHSGVGRNPGVARPVRSYNLVLTYPCQPPPPDFSEVVHCFVEEIATEMELLSLQQGQGSSDNPVPAPSRTSCGRHPPPGRILSSSRQLPAWASIVAVPVAASAPRSLDFNDAANPGTSASAAVGPGGETAVAMTFRGSAAGITPVPARQADSKRRELWLSDGWERGNIFPAQGWFPGLMAIGNQPEDQVDPEVGWAAVAGRLNLRDILQLPVNRFDDGPLTKQGPVFWGQGAGFHIPLQPGNQLVIN